MKIKQAALLSVFLISFFCLPHLTYSQKTSEIDSLLKIVEDKSLATEKVDAYVTIFEKFRGVDEEIYVPYLAPALQLAKSSNYDKGISDVYHAMSGPTYVSNDYDSVLVLADLIYYHAQKVNYKNGMANACNLRLVVYRDIDEHEKAEKYALEYIDLSKSIKNDIGLSNVYCGLAYLFADKGQYDSALYYNKRALDLINVVDQVEKYGIIEKSAIYSAQAHFLRMTGDYKSALEMLEKILESEKYLGKRSLQGIYYIRGNIKRDQGQYVSALSDYLESEELCLQLGAYDQTINLYSDLGICHAYMGNLNKADAYFKKGLNIALEYKRYSRSSSLYNNIGYLKVIQERYDSALNYLTTGIEMALKTNSKPNLALLYGSMADLYLAKNELPKVIDYYQKSIENYEEMGRINELTLNLSGIASYYYKNKEYQKALDAADKCIRISKTIDAKESIKEALFTKSKAYAALGLGMNAYNAHVMHKAYADSLFNAQQVKEFAKLESEFQFQQQKDSIQFATEKEKLAMNATIESGKARQLAALAALTAVVLVLIILGVFYYQNRKKNQKLTLLNKEVQNQNAEIKAQRDHLQDLNQTKTRFFSIISHDLRGPMSSFQALSSIIDFNLQEENYEELREVNQEVVKRSKEISLLLDNLLSWAVSEEGQFPYNPESTSVKESLEQIKEVYAPVALYKNISITDETNEDIRVWADPNSFKTIIRNLVSNAIKFTPQGGEVKIAAAMQDTDVLIRVSDNGIGIAEDKYKELFTMMENKSTRGTSGESGVGLGLRLVKDFVELNKGSVTVKSTVGEGTQFDILIPAFNTINVAV